jgi:hypothetical protein
MSEILDAVGSVLETAGVGTLGTSIFLSRSPDTPDACVVVYESGAGYPIYTHGTTGSALLVTNVQVIARAGREDYQAARTKITAVITAMEAVSNTVASGVTLLRAEQLNRPLPMGYDDNDRPEIAMNFTVTHV